MRKRKELLKRISVINDDGFVVCNFIYSQTEINRYKKYYYSIYREQYNLSYCDYLIYMNYLKHIDIEAEAMCDMDTILRRFNWFNETYHLDDNYIHETINFIDGSNIKFQYIYDNKTYIFCNNISNNSLFHSEEYIEEKNSTYKHKVYLDYPTCYVKQSDLFVIS